jgi:transposase
VVEETLAGGGSVSVVARRHDLNANLLFNWRKRYQKGTLNGARDTPPALVPIRVAAPCQEAPVTGRGSEVAALELMLASGHRVWIHGAIDPAVLRAALEVLSR